MLSELVTFQDDAQSIEILTDTCIYEVVKSKDNLEIATEQFSKGLTDIIRKVNVHENILFSDFVCGVDMAFDIPKDTSPKIRRAKIRQIHFENGYFTEEEAQTLLESSEDDSFFIHLNKLYILHWTAEEILKQRKTLRGNRQITLQDALKIPTMVTLDLLHKSNDKWSSVTIIYNFHYSPDTAICPVKVYTDKLTKGLITYDPSVVLKTLWFLSKISGNDHSRTIKSDLARINTEINTLKKVLINNVSRGVFIRAGETIIRANGETSSGQQLTSEDINLVYLQILKFGRDWTQIQDDLQTIYDSWLSWKAVGVFNVPSMLSMFENWQDLLKKPIREQTKDLYNYYIQITIT